MIKKNLAKMGIELTNLYLIAPLCPFPKIAKGATVYRSTVMRTTNSVILCTTVGVCIVLFVY